MGHGDQQKQLLPKKIEAFADRRVVAVSAGPMHSFALTADGAVWSWGMGGLGQLGHGDEEKQLVPKVIDWILRTPLSPAASWNQTTLPITGVGGIWSPATARSVAVRLPVPALLV